MTKSLPELAIDVSGLNKTYAPTNGQPAKVALRDVSLSIPRGSFFGLLGPNGAGKSTLINILAGLVIKSSGTARIWGFDIEAQMRQARSSIGVVPQELNIDPFFTPRQVLEVQAGLYGVRPNQRRTEEILRAVHLFDKADAYARSLSGGMRRRLLVAKAMVHAPPVLVLDEPTAGVDVELRQQLWEYVRELRDQGTTILLTTHYLEEAEELCDEIAIINNGRLIAHERTEDLLHKLESKELILTVDRDLVEVPPSLSGFNAEIKGPRTLVIHVPHTEVPIELILSAIKKEGLTIEDIRTEESDLEDIFLVLTQRDREEVEEARTLENVSAE